MTTTHAPRVRRIAALLLLGATAATGAMADTTPGTPELDPTITASTTGAPMQFSSDLSGTWTARGDVLPNLDMERPFRVRCEFEVDAGDTTFDLDGECGALFVKRPISTSLTREGDAISGTYDADLRSGVAQLDGRETDEGIALDVEWGEEVNGDTAATMRIVREGDKLRILTVDRDPATGEDVTTTDLLLERG